MADGDTILYVEDREEDVFLLEHAFCTAEIKNPVQVVRDGQEAIDYLSGVGKFADRKQFPLPALLLLDLKLPMLMGLDVLEWIRLQPSLRAMIVIVLSSSIHEGDIQRAYQLGVNAFLVKPSDADTTADMCKALKHFWLTYNRAPGEISWTGTGVR
jgi:CheY-like chemotaxis protein